MEIGWVGKMERLLILFNAKRGASQRQASQLRNRTMQEGGMYIARRQGTWGHKKKDRVVAGTCCFYRLGLGLGLGDGELKT